MNNVDIIPGITVLDGDTNGMDAGDEPDDDLPGDGVCC